MDLAGPS